MQQSALALPGRMLAISMAAVCAIAISPLACRGRARHPAHVAWGGGPPAGIGLGDDEVAGVIAAIRTSSIEQAELATDRAHERRVREFADRIVVHQSRAGQSVNGVLARLRIQPRDSSISREIVRTSADNLHDLTMRPDRDFDRVWLETRVRSDEHALAVIDARLVADVHQPELRGQVEQIRRMLIDHLHEMRSLLATLPQDEARSAHGG